MYDYGREWLQDNGVTDHFARCEGLISATGGDIVSTCGEADKIKLGDVDRKHDDWGRENDMSSWMSREECSIMLRGSRDEMLNEMEEYFCKICCINWQNYW